MELSSSVKRSDISLEEDRSQDFYNHTYSCWRATLDGTLSTGETVRLNRTAVHAALALENLEEAIEAEGWVIE